MQLCGSCDAGSIPAERTKLKEQIGFQSVLLILSSRRKVPAHFSSGIERRGMSSEARQRAFDFNLNKKS